LERSGFADACEGEETWKKRKTINLPATGPRQQPIVLVPFVRSATALLGSNFGVMTARHIAHLIVDRSGITRDG